MENNQTNTQEMGMQTQQEGENATQQEEKTFTQDEVNRIVQDRLAKERNRSGHSFEERELELTRRENRMTCAERLAEKKYPKELIDILDTSDVDKFMKNVETLAGMEIRSEDSKPIPRVVSITRGINHDAYRDSDFRKAFGLGGKDEE